MLDALPGHIGDVQQAIDAAEIDECTVVGEVLDDTLDGVAFLQARQQRFALCAVLFLDNGTTRNNDVVATLVQFDDLEFEALALEVARIAHRTYVDERSRQERTYVVDFNGEAALDTPVDDAVDDFAVLVGFFEARSTCARESLSRETGASHQSRLQRRRARPRLRRQRLLRLRRRHLLNCSTGITASDLRPALTITTSSLNRDYGSQ